MVGPDNLDGSNGIDPRGLQNSIQIDFVFSEMYFNCIVPEENSHCLEVSART